MSVAVRSVAAWRSATTYPPLRSRSTGGAERPSPRPLASGCGWREPSSSESRSQPAAAASAASTSGSSKRQRTRPRVCQFGSFTGGALERLGAGLADPEVADLALGDELGHRADRL